MSGGQRFKITVEGVDKATPVVGKVDKAIGGLANNAAKVDGGLRRVADNPSLGNLGKDLTKIGSGAQDAVAWIGRLVPGIGTLAGIGAAGGLTTFVNSWTANAAQIGRAAQMIGQSTTELQAWQSAARSVGLTNEALNSSLEALAQNIQDATAFRNPTLQGIMASLNIPVRRTIDGAIDATAALEDLSAAYDATRKASGVQAANNLANAFGAGSLVPLLLQGRDAIKKLRDEAQQSGGIIRDEDVKRAIEYEKSLVRLGNAASGTANRLGSILTPAVIGASDAVAAGLTNINRLLEAAEKLPAKNTIGNAQFRRVALASAGITPATSPTNSLILKWLGDAADAGSSMGTDLGNWLMKEQPKKPPTPAQSLFGGGGDAWWRQKPIAEMTQAELAAIGRANPVAVSGPDGTLVIKLQVDTAPGLNTRSVVQQNTGPNVKVETFMTGGP